MLTCCILACSEGSRWSCGTAGVAVKAAGKVDGSGWSRVVRVRRYVPLDSGMCLFLFHSLISLSVSSQDSNWLRGCLTSWAFCCSFFFIFLHLALFVWVVNLSNLDCFFGHRNLSVAQVFFNGCIYMKKKLTLFKKIWGVGWAYTQVSNCSFVVEQLDVFPSSVLTIITLPCIFYIRHVNRSRIRPNWILGFGFDLVLLRNVSSKKVFEIGTGPELKTK